MKRLLVLAVFAAAPFTVFATGCQKVVPIPDAGVVDATAAVDTSDAGTTAAADLDASIEAAAPLATVAVHATTTATHAVAAGGPFQGNFNCNAQTTQHGNVLTGSIKGNSFTCTISGEVCDGHVQPGGKHFTFKRNGSGDLTFSQDGDAHPVFCKKQ